VTRAINADVGQINRNLDGSIARASTVDGQTSTILGQANQAHRSAACIDRKLVLLGGTADGAC